MRKVKLYLKDEIIEGYLVKEDSKHSVIKLSNGYNIGILKDKIDKIENIIETDSEETEKSKSKIEQRSDLPKVLILHTGGTIASKVDYKTGAVEAQFDPNELLSLFPEMKNTARIESRLLRNMMSGNIRFAHYNIIAKAIAEEIERDKHLKGIVITHGTDTMHYSSAALSFALENINIPIVLVGSQRSSDRGSSDSAMNIISAVAFIANTTLFGVYICMHENSSDNSCYILNGINARKMHSSTRDAFRPINIPPIARINYSTKEIEYISEVKSNNVKEGKLLLKLFDEKLRIGIIVSHPNMFSEELLAYKNFNGVVLEGTGLGHFPVIHNDDETIENHRILDAIKTLCNHMPVVVSTQTIFGRVNLNVYSYGREMLNVGVIGDQSMMTPETSFIKLAWLLSNKLDPRVYFMKNFRGEVIGD